MQLFTPISNGRILAQFILLVLLSFSIEVGAQNLKTYKGAFKQGHAVYQFYQLDNKKKIFSGAFTYNIGDHHLEVGLLINDLKTGEWHYFDKTNDVTIEISGNYQNNFKNGKWLFRRTENEVTSDYHISFRNDSIMGNIEFKGLNGSFDENGKFASNWSVPNDNSIYIAKFKENVLVFLEHKTKNGNFLGVYRPNYNIDFTKLGADNPISKKQYELDWNFRMMSGDFDVNQIYGINDVKINGISTECLEKELLFNNFFDSILADFNADFFDEISWEMLQSLQLKVNPEFLYLNKIKPETKVKTSDKEHEIASLDAFYNTTLVDEKPVFKLGNNNFMKYITNNYPEFETVSGKVMLDFVVDRNGKLIVGTIQTSGGISESEIRRILNNSPTWTPATKAGKTVDVKFLIPLNVVRK